MLRIYFNGYYDLSDEKLSEKDPKYDPANLTLDQYDYSEWYKEKSGDEAELKIIAPTRNDEF